MKNAPGHNRHFGQIGEQQAADYLKNQGYELLEMNWRSGRIELDIIAREGAIVVFVEVKNRADKNIALPEQAVTPAKQLRIAKAAGDYIEQIGHKGEIRFDIIAISGPEIYHIRDAFFPSISF